MSITKPKTRDRRRKDGVKGGTLLKGKSYRTIGESGTIQKRGESSERSHVRGERSHFHGGKTGLKVITPTNEGRQPQPKLHVCT